MRAAWTGAATLLALSAVAQADERTARVEARDTQSLKDALLTLTQEHLQPAGLALDRARAWLSLSRPLQATDTYTYEVRAAWPTGLRAPLQPFTFELRPDLRPSASTAGDLARTDQPTRASLSVQPIRASLAVPLLREVWTAARRLRKGSTVACDDFSRQQRDVRDVPRYALTSSCEVGTEVVALRDIAAGEVMRSVDIGVAPDVMAGARVRVSVATKGISVTTTAVALTDGKVGDQVDVRMQRPTRTLRTRVTGPGSVRLADGSS